LIYLVIYDISDNKLRGKIAKFLKQMGLKRVQKSAFVGSLKSSDIRNLESGIRLIVKGKVDYNVQLYPLTEVLFNQRVIFSTPNYSPEEEEVI
jgi:CRISPR-associated protein Cas2